MGQWNHSCCYDCWVKERGLTEPVRVRDHEPIKCCICGNWTIEGIFIRRDPKLTSCIHDEDI